MTLEVGQQVGPLVFELTAEAVEAYVEAVGDSRALYMAEGVAPFAAVAALGVRTILQGLALPAGTMHLAQEQTSHRAAPLGERFTCTATVVQRSRRQDGAFLIVEFAVTNARAQSVMEGRSTLMLPQSVE